MRFLMAVVSLLALSACEAILGAEGVTTLATGKTMSDHVVSVVSGKNCSSVRANNGQNFCVEDDVPPPQNIYCYPTLGSVTCYDRPDPHKGRYRTLGDNDTSLSHQKY